jgi:hypothetical protein
MSRAFGPGRLSVNILGVVAPDQQSKDIHLRAHPSQLVSHPFIHQRLSKLEWRWYSTKKRA